jgi:D-alanyl-D-alanine carboxypeptidase
MRKRTCIPAILLILLLIGCGEAADMRLPYAQALQDTLDAERESAGLVGVSAAIIVPGYDAWLGVSGESHPGKPITEEMLFDMGSTGKIILGPLMVKLAEEDMLSLDDPISTYLPDFPYADGSITIRQLLNHTSGLSMMVKHPGSPFRKPYADIDHERWWTIDEVFNQLGGDPYFPPGEGWCYTQAGYQIATLIVEAVTGQTIPEVVQTYLMDPLNIKGMLLDFSKTIPDDANIAHPWLDINQDGLYEDVHGYSRNWIASLSRILFYANAQDLASWGHALFAGEVLNQDAMTEMLDFYRMDDLCGEPPLITGYGLGIEDYDVSLTMGQPAWGHLGSIPGYRTFLAYLPKHKVTMAVMTNTDADGALAVVDGLLKMLLEHLGGTTEALPALEVKPVKQPPADARVFATFQKESLFCTHDAQWTLTASSQDWINISLDWVVGTDPDKAENAWRFHTHTITVNGVKIPDVEQYAHEVIHYSVTCPDETLEIWAKSLSIYLPPFPAGQYEIKWHSQITGEFNNGWVTYEPGNYLEIVAQLIIE